MSTIHTLTQQALVGDIASSHLQHAGMGCHKNCVGGTFSKVYKQLTEVPEIHQLSFKLQVNRQCYIQTYVPGHAVMLKQALGKFSCLSNLFSQQSLRVVSVGGGPGSDIIGILAHIGTLQTGRAINLAVTVVDAVKQWQLDWNKVFTAVRHDSVNLSTTYYPLDVSNQEDVDDLTDVLAGCQLVTMVKFASSIFALDNTRSFWERLFTDIEPGCFVLIVDNYRYDTTDEFTDLAVKVAEECGTSIVYRSLQHDVEQKDPDMDAISTKVRFCQTKHSHCPYKPKYMSVLLLQKSRLHDDVESLTTSFASVLV